MNHQFEPLEGPLRSSERLSALGDRQDGPAYAHRAVFVVDRDLDASERLDLGGHAVAHFGVAARAVAVAQRVEVMLQHPPDAPRAAAAGEEVLQRSPVPKTMPRAPLAHGVDEARGDLVCVEAQPDLLYGRHDLGPP